MITTSTVGFFKFYFDDDQKFSFEIIADIKNAVPSASRTYNPDTHEWTITDEWRPVVRKIHDSYYAIPNYDLFEDREAQ